MKTYEKYINEKKFKMRGKGWRKVGKNILKPLIKPEKVKAQLTGIITQFEPLTRQFENPNMKKDAETLVKIAKKLHGKL